MTFISRKPKKEKKEYEFMQKVILINWALTALWITLSYALTAFALLQGISAPEINSAVTLALVSESLGVSLAYAITNSQLKKNLNDNKLKIQDGVVSFVEGQILQEGETNENGENLQ